MTITANASSGKPQQLGDTQKQAAIPKILVAPNGLKQVQTPNQAGTTESRLQAKAQIVLALNTAVSVVKPPGWGFLAAFSIPLSLAEPECSTQPSNRRKYSSLSGG